jgi:site-specific DNA recombinase
LPRLHPRLAELYRRKVEQLGEALECPATHEEALEILRQLIEKVVVRATEAGFEIDLSGEIASMLALAADTSATNSKEFRRSVKVVAGEGVEPPTLGL